MSVICFGLVLCGGNLDNFPQKSVENERSKLVFAVTRAFEILVVCSAGRSLNTVEDSWVEVEHSSVEVEDLNIEMG